MWEGGAAAQVWVPVDQPLEVHFILCLLTTALHLGWGWITTRCSLRPPHCNVMAMYFTAM
jgi:hypothetical protein